MDTPEAEIQTIIAGIWVSNEWLCERAARKNAFPGGDINTTVLDSERIRLSIRDYNSFKIEDDPTFEGE